VHSAILRKRILRVFIVVLSALMYAASVYYQSTYLRTAGEWRGFWVGEAMVGVYLVVGIVRVLRQAPKS